MRFDSFNVRYWTIRVRFALSLMALDPEPKFAVTVIVYVPALVPVGPFPPPAVPPPPHDVSVKATSRMPISVNVGTPFGQLLFRIVKLQVRIAIDIKKTSGRFGRRGNSVGESFPTGNDTIDLAAVVTVTVAVAAAGPPTATVGGETLHVVVAGAPLQLIATLPLNPPIAPSESV